MNSFFLHFVENKSLLTFYLLLFYDFMCFHRFIIYAL